MKVKSLISQADHQSNGLADHGLSGVKDPSVQTSHKRSACDKAYQWQSVLPADLLAVKTSAAPVLRLGKIRLILCSFSQTFKVAHSLQSMSKPK